MSRSPPLLRMEDMMRFTGFISIIVAVVLILLALFSWFDYMDRLDNRVALCISKGGQMVRVHGTSKFTCMKVSPIILE